MTLHEKLHFKNIIIHNNMVFSSENVIQHVFDNKNDVLSDI